MLLSRHWRNIFNSSLAAVGVLSILLASACGGGGGGGGGGGSNDSIPNIPTDNDVLSSCADNNSCMSNPTLEIGKNRPAYVQIPSDYNTATQYPLIILLHAFRSSGPTQSKYFGFDARADTQQYILVLPNGTKNEKNQPFWNATPACCAQSSEDFQIDDVAYIRSLIEEAAVTYSIDPTRISIIGHSNGGFMTLRMVCEASDLVTSVVSLAGAAFLDEASCAPATHPVSVLTIHGDADAAIDYDGGIFFNNEPYPSAADTSRRYASLAECDTRNPVMAPNIDLLGSITGAETSVLQYTGCPLGIGVEFWTMVGAPHSPPWERSGLDSVIDWVMDHPRE